MALAQRTPPYPARRNHLSPEDALVVRKLGQVYDPLLGFYRPQRVHGARPGSSLCAPKDSYPRSRRSSVSSYSRATSHQSRSTAPTRAASASSSRRSSVVTRPGHPRRPSARSAYSRFSQEIYDCVLRQLRALHTDLDGEVCLQCYLRDMCNLAVTSKRWDWAVRIRLYDRIHITGPESSAQLEKYNLKSGVRLKLLRRTLRSRPELGTYVHELCIPDPDGDDGFPIRSMADLIASVIMACPNLERLTAFTPSYSHVFSRIIHALSTRSRLVQHTWRIGENAAITKRSHIQPAPGLVDAEQTSSFLNFHALWTNLATLRLHAQPGAILEHGGFTALFPRLPSLQHLAISAFDADDFNDTTLLSIPALRSLSLHALPGVTALGLTRLGSHRTAPTLHTLTLHTLAIPSICPLAKLLISLPALRALSLTQPTAPTILASETVIPPVLASSTLRHLSWATAPAPTSSNHLALSLAANGFPALRTLYAPCDLDGALQALCAPMHSVPGLSNDGSSSRASSSATHASLPRSSVFAPTPSTLPLSVLDPAPPTPEEARAAERRQARMAAQARIEAARREVGFRVFVEDADVGRVVTVYEFASYVGKVGAGMSYVFEEGDGMPGGDVEWWVEDKGVG